MLTLSNGELASNRTTLARPTAQGLRVGDLDRLAQIDELVEIERVDDGEGFRGVLINSPRYIDSTIYSVSNMAVEMLEARRQIRWQSETERIRVVARL